MTQFALAAAFAAFTAIVTGEQTAHAASMRDVDRTSETQSRDDGASASKADKDRGTSVTSCRRPSAHQRYLMRRAVRRAVYRRTRGH